MYSLWAHETQDLEVDYCKFELAESIHVISSSLYQCDGSCWAELTLDRVSLGDKAQIVSGGLPFAAWKYIPSLDVAPAPEVISKSSPSYLGQEVLSLLGKQAVDLPVSPPQCGGPGAAVSHGARLPSPHHWVKKGVTSLDTATRPREIEPRLIGGFLRNLVISGGRLVFLSFKSLRAVSGVARSYFFLICGEKFSDVKEMRLK